MPTAITTRDQLADLRLMIDWGDPAQVEAEAAFAAMVSEIMHESGMGPKGHVLCTKLTSVAPPVARGSVCEERPAADPLAIRLMSGTAEAYDAFAQTGTR